jgi:REP element-mobilizing transposase RayT
VSQFITFRLKDSLPQEVVERWRVELEGKEGEAELRRRVEAYLDAGHGRALLRDAGVASLVEAALLHFDGQRYRLAAWVVMPNHVHLLLTPLSGYTLSSIMHSLKSYTAREANKLLRREGALWQEEYFDRFIRDAKHYAQTIAYIEANPVKAGLCLHPEDWPYGSARKRREREHTGPPPERV